MYTYYNLIDDINYLKKYCIETGSIGKSFLSRDIPYFHLGDNINNQIFITGGIHAREHVSSLLVMRQLFCILNNFKEIEAGCKLKGGIYFIPMLNPDGNLLIAEGLNSVPYSMKKDLLELNSGKNDFSLWKANIKGVDLNTNFDAKWGKGKQNIFSKSSANFIGNEPFSENETKAIRDFTLKIKPKATVSYHALGQELYWEFGQNDSDKARDRLLAEYLNKDLNYKIVDDDFTSTGGYKDWCIQELKIPSFTIELVPESYTHPLADDNCIADDFRRNKNLPVKLLREINEIF